MAQEVVVPAPLWRRLAAALYDGLLLLAVWMVTAFVDATVRTLLGLPYAANQMQALMFLTGLAFFGWFWVHGGQTLGMRAWRLKVRRVDGSPLNWAVACGRYGTAWIAWLPFAAGVLWCAIDPRRRSWNDMLTGTEVVQLPRDATIPPAASPPAGP